MYTYIHTHTHTHVQTATGPTRVFGWWFYVSVAPSRRRTHACAHACMYARPHACMRARMHVCAHARAHACTRTYAHTHTSAQRACTQLPTRQRTDLLAVFAAVCSHAQQQRRAHRSRRGEQTTTMLGARVPQRCHDGAPVQCPARQGQGGAHDSAATAKK